MKKVEAADKIIVEAQREVAFDSPDYRMPWGTRRDNSRNRRFNQKLYKLFGDRAEPLWILDLGCSGGGFVKDCLDDGCFAVGIEGSDFSKRHKRAEWRTIPENLFTADVTYPFSVYGQFGSNRRKLAFDTITSWEMLEHIAEKDLEALASNIKAHLLDTGIFIGSISPNPENIGGVELHQTVRPEGWWVERFAKFGLHNLPAHVAYFNTQFVRGPKFAAPGSFHVVLSTNPEKAPRVPGESLAVRIFDQWLGSTPQRLLRHFVVGV